MSSASYLKSLFIGSLGVFAMHPASAVTWALTFELPGIQHTTTSFSSMGVESFDSVSVGSQNFISSFDDSSFSGSYTGVAILNASQYGGAGNSGHYASTPLTFSREYSITLSTPVNYFGFWYSSITQSSDRLTFFKGANQLAQFDISTIFWHATLRDAAYSQNPNAPSSTGSPRQAYAFVNFYALGADNFDRIVFSASSGVQTESDNHTVGIYNGISGLPVPEPGSAMLMIFGIGSLLLCTGHPSAFRLLRMKFRNRRGCDKLSAWSCESAA